MGRSLIWLRACAAGGLLFSLSTWWVNVAAAADGDVAAGKILFERQWKSRQNSDGIGDGLGPVFNARSCAACHHQTAPGGGGKSEHNAQMLTIVAVSPNKGGVTPQQAQHLLTQIHPGFQNGPQVAVHRHGTENDYAAYRANLLAAPEELPWPKASRTWPAGLTSRRLEQPPGMIQIGPLVLRVTERSTPALFGAGQIDRVSDQTRRMLAANQPSAMRGVVAGRFGWKGQTADLASFVRGACANELGLQSLSQAQPPDPTQKNYQTKRVDMTKAEMRSMVNFVASLPAPPADRSGADPESIRNGSAAFTRAGCAVCHTPDVDGAKGIYSELLHDMGVTLADATGLVFPGTPAFNSQPSPLTAYYGGPTAQETAATFARTWRTPPLWGVRNSAPYMHDGRAATIEEAIQLHNGQAQTSLTKFQDLTKQQQAELVGFVRSLGAGPADVDLARNEAAGR